MASEKVAHVFPSPKPALIPVSERLSDVVRCPRGGEPATPLPADQPGKFHCKNLSCSQF
jgi:hypothetical protein